MSQIKQNVLNNAVNLIQYDECDACGKIKYCFQMRDNSYYGVDLVLCTTCATECIKRKQKDTSPKN